MNLALRVADELSGCDADRAAGHELWSAALAALQRRGRALDSDNIERLFWPEKRHVRASLHSRPLTHPRVLPLICNCILGLSRRRVNLGLPCAHRCLQVRAWIDTPSARAHAHPVATSRVRPGFILLSDDQFVQKCILLPDFWKLYSSCMIMVLETWRR